MRRSWAALLLFCLAATAPAVAEPPALQTVPHVDLQRYLGLWHEMARYDNWFQGADCVNVTAEYGLRDDGKITVSNICRNAAGAVTDEADGTATVADSLTNAKLRVSFSWPIYGDYWVVALADDYSWAIVSEPGRDYLWVLVRQSPTPEALKNQLVAKVAELGFDPNRLVFSQR